MTELKVKETITDNNGNVKIMGALTKYHPILEKFWQYIPHTADEMCRCSVYNCENFGAILLDYGSESAEYSYTHTICFDCYRANHTELNTKNVLNHSAKTYSLLRKWDKFTIFNNEYIHNCSFEGCTNTENLRAFYSTLNINVHTLEENNSIVTIQEVPINLQRNYFCLTHFEPKKKKVISMKITIISVIIKVVPKQALKYIICQKERRTTLVQLVILKNLKLA